MGVGDRIVVFRCYTTSIYCAVSLPLITAPANSATPHAGTLTSAIPESINIWTFVPVSFVVFVGRLFVLGPAIKASDPLIAAAAAVIVLLLLLLLLLLWFYLLRLCC